MTDIRQLLASNIKTYRKLHGWTQEKLAEEAKTATGYIATIETGKKFPSARMLERLASALRIDTPELFTTQAIQFIPLQHESVSRLYQDILEEIQEIIYAKINKLNK
jgi:transcriptional regulator with XRE-family HTH domain